MHYLVKIKARKQREPIAAPFAEGSTEAQRGNEILPKPPAIQDGGRIHPPTVSQGSAPRLLLRQVSLTLICFLIAYFNPLEPTFPRWSADSAQLLPSPTP